MEQQKSLKSNAIFSFLKAFLNIATPLITFPYASRLLLPQGIGKVNFANTVVSYFIILAKLGIDNYAIREASKIKNDKKLLSKFFKEIFCINSCSTIIAFILFFISIFTIDKLNEYRSLLLIISIRLLSLLFEVPWLFSAKEEFKSVTIRTSIFQIISLIYLFVFVKSPDDIGKYALYGVMTYSLTSISNFIIAIKFIDFKIHISLEIKKHIPFILTFLGMSFITTFYNMLDIGMLGFLSNDTEVGYYSAAIKINNLVIELISAIVVILLPRLSYLKEKNELQEFNKLSVKGFNIVLFFSIPFCFGAYVLSNQLIIMLSSEKFLDAVLPMKILCPLIMFISISNLIGTQIFPALNKEKTSLLVYSIAILVNIAINIVLIPKIGATGAAVSTIIAEGLVTLILLILSRKLIFTKECFINFFECLLSGFLMYIVIYFTLPHLHGIILQTSISILLGCFTYCSILFAFKNVYLMQIINKFIRK